MFGEEKLMQRCLKSDLKGLTLLHIVPSRATVCVCLSFKLARALFEIVLIQAAQHAIL